MTVKQSLTTEQLGKAVIKSLEQMSPEELAVCREHLDKGFGREAVMARKKVIHDIEHTAPDSVLGWMLQNKIQLTLENYIDIAFMSTPPDGIEEDGEFLASVPDVILNGPRMVQ